MHPKNSISSAGELLLYGEIGSWWDDMDALGVVRQLEQMNKDQITVRIHSGGGLILEGLAIYNRLKESKAFVTVYIDGLAASMASVVAMAGDKVVMPENAWLMVHKPWVGTSGNSEELRKMADTLDGFEASLISIYTNKTGKTTEEISALLASETWINAADALAFGFIDEISTSVKAAASIDLSAFTNIPAELSAKPQAAQSVNQVEEKAMPIEVKGATDQPVAEVKNQVNDAALAAAITTERTRVSGIQTLADKHDLPKALASDLIASGASLQDAKDKTLEILAARDAKVKCGGGAIVESNFTNARAAVANAIEARIDHTVALRDDARPFRVMSMIEIARSSLQMSGVNTQFMNHDAIAAMAMHSTSDFPLILQDVMNKRLIAAYEAAPKTFMPFCKRRDVSDFKAIKTVALSGAPDLEEINEGGEYKHGTMSEEGQSYSLKTYGKMLYISRKAIIDDDLQAFTRFAPAFGESAAEKESDVVYGLLTGSGTLSDGQVLFHSTHKNLGTAGVLSETTLSQARKMLRKQTGVSQSRPLNLTAVYLIIPSALETAAEKMLAGILAATSATVNPFSKSLQIIVEPRLDAISETAWYLSAAPNRIDTIEYGYLSGNQGVFTEIQNGFDVDGLKIKARLDFAAGVVDFRGLFKNAGA